MSDDDVAEDRLYAVQYVVVDQPYFMPWLWAKKKSILLNFGV